jgi:hypothetical protein
LESERVYGARALPLQCGRGVVDAFESGRAALEVIDDTAPA